MSKQSHFASPALDFCVVPSVAL